MRSEKWRVSILVLALLLCLGLLTACGKDGKNETKEPTATVTPTNTATPSPTPTPEPWKFYEKAGEADVYRVPVKELTPGSKITSTAYGGEYVALQIWENGEDIPGPEWGTIVLLRPAFSAETVRMEPSFPVHGFYVLADGTVIIEESASGKIHIYDATLTEKKTLDTGAGEFSLVTVTKDGHLWVCDKEKGTLTYSDRYGENATTYDSGKGRNVFQYMGGFGGNQYFRAFEADEFSTDTVLCVGTADGTVTTFNEELWNIDSGTVNPYYTTSANMFYHSSSANWYLHNLPEDGHWIMLPKYFRYEDLDLRDGNILITRGYLPGAPSTDYTRSEPSGSRVYDLTRKMILCEIESTKITECDRFDVVGILGRRCAVIQSFNTNDDQELLLWDITTGTPAPLTGYHDLTAETPEACYEKVCQECKEVYGIDYTPRAQKTVSADSGLVATLQQIDFMITLAHGIAENPEVFPKDENGVAVYLENNRGHEPGHYEFNPYVFSELNETFYGADMKEAFFSMVDTVRAGEEWFTAKEKREYYWTLGMFAPRFYPASTAFMKTDYDVRETDTWKDGKGRVKYIVSIEEAKQKMQEFEQRICDIINDSIGDDYTDFEKALGLYEYITQHWSYDWELYSHIDDSSWWSRGSVYRCIMDRVGICWEIGGMYDYLLGQVGVRGERSEGWNELAKESHAWTLLVLDGKGYHVDPTWGLAGGGKTPLEYFCFTDAVRAERDSFPTEKLVMLGTDELTRETCPLNATDASFEPLWEGSYIGMDRVNKNVIYLDKTGKLCSFHYGDITK